MFDLLVHFCCKHPDNKMPAPYPPSISYPTPPSISHSTKPWVDMTQRHSPEAQLQFWDFLVDQHWCSQWWMSSHVKEGMRVVKMGKNEETTTQQLVIECL